MASRNFLIGVFKDERALLDAAQLLKKKGVEIYDAFSPFPIHGIDEFLGIRRTRLPIVCFVAGVFGCLCAFGLRSGPRPTVGPLMSGENL